MLLLSRACFSPQMVWENGCVVIVMLTPLVESGVKQCYHYWPDEGSNLYHIYEVNRRQGGTVLAPPTFTSRSRSCPGRSTWCLNISGVTTSWSEAST